MSLAGREIAVIGAGIGGLAAATAMAARGARVQVFEQAPRLEDVGAGIQVAPNGVAVLEALGLRDFSERLASAPEAIELREHELGRRVACLPLGQVCVARYGRPYWQFHRADLLSVLAAGASEEGVELHLGARVSDLETDDEGARFAVGARSQGRAEIVIAADGIRSPVRAAHFDPAEARFTRHVAWRGLVDMQSLPPDLLPQHACVTMGPRRHVVTYPLRHASVMNFVAIEERAEWTSESWMEADDPERLRKAFAGWGGGVETLFAGVEQTYLWGLFDHPPLDSWVSGRIALLGDACHPMLPFLAQGATMALEDAWVLAAELDVADDLEAGLLAYEARRHARASHAQRAAARQGRIYHLGPWTRPAVHAGLRAASTLMPSQLLARFDWLYGADVVSAQATA